MRIILLILFCFPLLFFAQSQDKVKGKVVSEFNDLEGIHVINKTQDILTVTSRGGYFEITASENDTLLFSSINLKAYTHVVSVKDYESDLLFIPMESLVNLLDEVTMTEYKNINAESLRIVPKGQRTYTPAERKLLAAGDFKWYSPLLIPVGGMSVDGLINSISGRTSMLKKELKIEYKEAFLQRLSETFDTKFMVERLKIPEDYVEGFMYFVIDNQSLIQAIKTKNRDMAIFILSEQASKYKALKELN